jgi:DNA-binding LacI/PurR family transcriptional regulator
VNETAGANHRVRGYIIGLNQRGLVFDPALTAAEPETFAGGAEAARRLMALVHPPTALLTHNDTVAVGVMHGLRAVGKRIPEDVSVVGFDNTEICDYLPTPLTSVSLPKQDLGQQAVRLVLAAIDRVEEPLSPIEGLSLPTELIVRASTGPAPS